jgi:hypothetical protein
LSQLGRISGPLLKANLLRNGIDLAFENDLLYLDVTNGRVGINTSTPSHELQVDGTTRTTNLEVTNSVSLSNFTISNNTISNDAGDITFTSPVIINNELNFDDMRIFDNVIETTTSNADLEIRTNGTGIIDLQSDVLVGGNLHVNGNITADGTIGLGDSVSDIINFNAKIASDLIPSENDRWTIGKDPSDSTNTRWNDLWAVNLYADAVFSANIVIDGINLATRPGNTYYVSVNGSDLNNTGTHQNDPVESVSFALSQATAGDTIWIYPGTYTETFPLVVPQGVTVRGTGIRSVTVQPTAATRNKNAFELNGESTVEDLTVANFEYDSGNDTGYAFVFANNITVTSRSPYIRNITVSTKGSTVRLGTNPPEDPLGFNAGDAGKGAKIDGSVANASSNEASMLFHSTTFITPGVDTITAINGTRVEWLNSFTYYANKGMNLLSGTSGFAGDGKTRVKISNTTGTFAVNDTLTYYDVDGTTVLAQGTIESINGDFYNIDGKVTGFETLEDRAGKSGTTYGDAQLDTAQAKFGTSGLLLDGTGDYVGYSTQPDFGFGTGDFTVEGWIRLGALAIDQTVFDFRNSADGDTAPVLRINTSNQLEFAPADTVQITGTALSNGIWYHVAVSRSSGSTKLFVNGTQQGSTYTDTNDYGTSKPLTIGAKHSGTNFLNGHLDDIRVSDIARYRANFAAPGAAFTSDTNTVLLLHFNGADGTTVIVDDGITTQDIRTTSGGTASKIDFANYSDFGVEVRAIGSANVYGNYGVYGDGDGVIAYLIGHNLAYIGTGKSSENDETQVVQANEITELNRAKILYSTVDQSGDFRVGDNFYVNQRTGEVSFSNSELDVTGSLTFTSGGNTTFIDATRIDTGNLRLSGNTVSSTTGDININPYTNQLNLNSDVTVTGDLNITQDANIGGNLVLVGDIILSAKVDSDIIPSLDDTYNLGSPTNQWNTVYASRLFTENIEIDNNKIRTLDSNSNLDLEAAGNGVINIGLNDVVVNQDVTVQGNTTLTNTTINGSLTQTGDQTITGDVVQTGGLTVDGEFTAGDLKLDAIEIVGNVIRSTESNANLELDAAGTGIIDIANNDVEIANTLTVQGVSTTTGITNTGDIISDSFSTDQLNIAGNVIENTQSNGEIVFRTSGSGNIILDAVATQVTQNFTVSGDTALSNTIITGTLDVTGNSTFVGNVTQTGSLNVSENISVDGYLQLDNIKIDTNYISTTESNSDLELRASGTGQVVFPTSNVLINNDLNVNGSIVTSNLSVTGSIIAPAFDSGDILIENNVVTTTLSNSDLELRASGTGEIYIPENNVQIDNDLNVDGVTSLRNTTINGTVTHIGDTVQTGNFNLTGAFNQTGDFTTSGFIDLPDLLIETNFISTKTSNSDLELRASGTGRIFVPNNDVEFGQNLTVTGDITASDINITGVLSAPVISNGNIEIDNNVIRTTESNSDLELRANGTGTVLIPTNDVQIDNDLTVSQNTNVETLTATNLIVNGNVVQTGNYTQSNGTQTLNGQLTVNDKAQFEEIQINTNFITTTTTNTDLELRAAGTGQVIVPSNDVTITQNLTIGGNITATGITVEDDLNADIISNGDIEIEGNVITTTLSNSNLELRANGAGVVLVPSNDVEIDNDLTVNGITNLSDTTINGVLTHTGSTVQTGQTTINGDIIVNGDVTIDGFGQFANVRIETNYISTTVTNQDLNFNAVGTGKVAVPVSDVQVSQDLEVLGLTTVANLTTAGTVTADVFETSDLTISGNLIENTSGSIVLSASGTGSIELEQILVDNNVISTTGNNDLVLQPNGTGDVVVNSTSSVILPSGTTLQQPVGQEGMIRFNTDFNGYEGFDGTQWRRLDGVYDLDQNTYITAELNPGTNDNIIRFYVNGALAATLDQQQLTANLLNVDDIEIDNNTISTITTNEDIVFAPNGTGSTKIGNFAFKDNTITNTVVDSVTTFNQTGVNGYFKIDGTNGFVIPVGQDSERGSLAEIGMIRFNTTDNRVEIFNGTQWISVAGAGGGVTITEAEDLSIRNALIFG